MKSTPLLLSAIVLTKNEEHNLIACLKSLHFVSEIVVIDDCSTDKTLVIAKKFKARIYIHSLNNNFSAQRNYGLKHAHGEWVLFVDADEQVSPSLAKEIVRTITNNSKIEGYFIRRIDIIWNKKISHGEMGSFGSFGKGSILRLARKNAGKWKRRIHEVWNIRGETGILLNELHHFPHQTYREFLSDISERAFLHAQSNSEEGKNSSVVKIIFWPIGKFLYNFIFKFGFLDGIEGFIIAITMSFHSFIAWSFLWLQQN